MFADLVYKSTQEDTGSEAEELVRERERELKKADYIDRDHPSMSNRLAHLYTQICLSVAPCLDRDTLPIGGTVEKATAAPAKGQYLSSSLSIVSFQSSAI